MSDIPDTPPDQVADGVWAIPVRIPSPRLKVVNSYAFDAGDGGLVLVDLGYSDDRSLASLEAGLAAIGAKVEDVRGVLFTHSHGDHYGLAGIVQERSGAWLGLHQADVWLVERIAGTRTEGGGLRETLEVAGAPVPESEGDAPGRTWTFPPPLPERILADGDRLQLGAYEAVVHHTPGHSPGHLCFEVRDAGVVLTGDHILSRTTPNVAAWPWTTTDPLGDYLQALSAAERFGDGLLGLPGHEDQMDDVGARAREIRDHHEEQLRAVIDIVGDGQATIAEVAEQMDWSRPWDKLTPMDRIMALGEGNAHLRLLETRGQLQRTDQRPELWSRVNGGALDR